MKHKHHNEIIAWANGAEIECFDINWADWRLTEYPNWGENTEYRIKPQPKPDVVKSYFVTPKIHCESTLSANLKLTFDGEGKLKAAEVIE